MVRCCDALVLFPQVSEEGLDTTRRNIIDANKLATRHNIANSLDCRVDVVGSPSPVFQVLLEVREMFRQLTPLKMISLYWVLLVLMLSKLLETSWYTTEGSI